MIFPTVTVFEFNCVIDANVRVRVRVRVSLLSLSLLREERVELKESFEVGCLWSTSRDASLPSHAPIITGQGCLAVRVRRRFRGVHASALIVGAEPSIDRRGRGRGRNRFLLDNVQLVDVKVAGLAREHRPAEGGGLRVLPSPGEAYFRYGRE